MMTPVFILPADARAKKKDGSGRTCGYGTFYT